MSVLSKTWAGDLVMENKQHVNAITVKGTEANTGVVYCDTWVRHVLEFGTSSDDQEDQVEDVEGDYNQEEDLHALEK